MIDAVRCSAAIIAVLSGCTSSLQGAQTVAPGLAISRETGRERFLPESLHRAAATEHLLHSFGPNGDGLLPMANLLNVRDTLYGTTTSGGAYKRGAVFKITLGGQETILHSFTGKPDGAAPVGSLINVNGTLYGSTYGGGKYGHGTVFAITLSGSEKIICSLGASDRDAVGPEGSLTSLNGVLYGTTSAGGVTLGKRCSVIGCGTVFSVTKDGQETVIYRFKGGKDGFFPMAGLINVNGTLYGTTFWGGDMRCTPAGCGTVYGITTTGVKTVLHNFSSPHDGQRPRAGLIDVNGMIYGTTSLGGYAHRRGAGTVFSIDTSGNEKVLYSFAGPPDGADPSADLLYVNGTLYGTTYYGGKYKCGTLPGCGTVFAVTTSGNESVLHSFMGLNTRQNIQGDGGFPVAGLIAVKATLYGTTENGGAYSIPCGQGYGEIRGCGTVFSITP